MKHFKDKAGPKLIGKVIHWRYWKSGVMCSRHNTSTAIKDAFKIEDVTCKNCLAKAKKRGEI